jgi:hypothetical protein
MLKRGLRKFDELWLLLGSGFEPVSLETILSKKTSLDIKLCHWEKDLGAGPLWDLIALIIITKALSPEICFEIGTGHGRTTTSCA